MLYLVKVCFKNGMMHAQSFEKMEDRDDLYFTLSTEFIDGKTVGTLFNGVALRYDDVLIITTEDVAKVEHEEFEDEEKGVC